MRLAFSRVVAETLEADSGARGRCQWENLKPKVGCGILDELERQGRLFRKPDGRKRLRRVKWGSVRFANAADYKSDVCGCWPCISSNVSGEITTAG